MDTSVVIINGEEFIKKGSVTNVAVMDNVVMVRTYSAGVHFGELISRDGKEVVLKNAYRVYSWVNACSLSQLAVQGSQDRASENKIAMAVPEIILTEAIEVIKMTEDAFKNLTTHIWKK